MAWGSRLGAVAVCLVVAGCTAAPAPPPPTPSPSGSTPSPAPRPEAEGPGDRDERAVVAALRRLDACALVDGAREPLGPHRCRVRTTGGSEVVVRLGTGIAGQDRHDRFHPRALAGAKAYVERWAGEGCVTHLPVSFDLTISFEVIAGPCTSDAVAEAAVPRVESAEPVERPMARWDPCRMLVAADRFMDGYDYGVDRMGEHGIDGCVAADHTGPTRSPRVLLTLEYGPDPVATGAVAGMPVAVGRVEDRCQVSWSHGVVGPRTDQVVTVRATTCEQARRVTADVLASAPEATGEPRPRRPLLYRPDEPDGPWVGACAHLVADRGCRPHTGVVLPDDPAALVRAAAKDADVSCAVGVDAVRARFPTLVPVATNGWCHFVQPSRTVMVVVTLSPEAATGRSGRPTTVGGLRAWGEDVRWLSSRARGVAVALSAGSLWVTLVADPPPGARRGDPVDPATLDHARGIAEDIVTTYLG